MPATSPNPHYDDLEQRLAGWASQRADVRAVLLIGSRSRSDHPADGWSDLDAIIFVNDDSVYKHPGVWKDDLEAAFGRAVWFAAYDYVLDVNPEYEYVLAGGLKVDLTFASTPLAASLSELLENSHLRFVFERGARPLVDKISAGQPLALPTHVPAPPPNQAEFDNRVASVLLELVRARNLSGRGELWRAARAVNEEMHANLLALLEWHARAIDAPGSDTWDYARFLEQWAGPRVLAALPATYTDSTLASTKAAIRASLDLLAWLGPETAERLGLLYPHHLVMPAEEWLRQYAE